MMRWLSLLLLFVAPFSYADTTGVVYAGSATSTDHRSGTGGRAGAPDAAGTAAGEDGTGAEGGSGANAMPSAEEDDGRGGNTSRPSASTIPDRRKSASSARGCDRPALPSFLASTGADE